MIPPLHKCELFYRAAQEFRISSFLSASNFTTKSTLKFLKVSSPIPKTERSYLYVECVNVSGWKR